MDNIVVPILMGLLFLGGAALGHATGERAGRKEMRQEAAKLGFGKFVVGKDADTVEFEWNKPVEKQETK